VPVAELILDFSLYPRTVTDEAHAARLAEALRAGETLPPVVAEQKTRRVVDGFHRIRAYLRAIGDEATCQVEWRDYASDVDLFLDAAKLNARHGLRISRLDEAHCMAVAARLGVKDTELAAVLALTAEKYEQLRASRFGTDNHGDPVLLKRSSRHLAGGRLTRKQIAGNAKSSGWRLDFHIDQIINAIESDLVNYQDQTLMPKLQRLHQLLDRSIAAHK
jgi:hypothetical protein